MKIHMERIGKKIMNLKTHTTRYQVIKLIKQRCYYNAIGTIIAFSVIGLGTLGYP